MPAFDFEYVSDRRAHRRVLAEVFDVAELVFDRYRIAYMKRELEDIGLLRCHFDRAPADLRQ